MVALTHRSLRVSEFPAFQRYNLGGGPLAECLSFDTTHPHCCVRSTTRIKTWLLPAELEKMTLSWESRSARKQILARCAARKSKRKKSVNQKRERRTKTYEPKLPLDLSFAAADLKSKCEISKSQRLADFFNSCSLSCAVLKQKLDCSVMRTAARYIFWSANSQRMNGQKYDAHDRCLAICRRNWENQIRPSSRRFLRGCQAADFRVRAIGQLRRQPKEGNRRIKLASKFRSPYFSFIDIQLNSEKCALVNSDIDAASRNYLLLPSSP